jgi:hypothetical protein
MDILQRAAGMIDRAQVRMVDATQHVARNAITTTRLRALEIRQAELRAQIETAVMDLGRLTFQRWKNHGVGNDTELARQCHVIDALNAEYQAVLGDIADARATGMPPPEYPRLSSPAPYALGTPRLTAIGQAQDPGVDYSGNVADSALAGSFPPPITHFSPKQSRECPECFTLVAGADSFCPSCGMRV